MKPNRIDTVQILLLLLTPVVVGVGLTVALRFASLTWRWQALNTMPGQ